MSEQYGTLWEMMDKRLEGLEQGQSEIKTNVAVIKERQSMLIDSVGNIKTTLYGNGRQGLITQVALIWQKVGIVTAVISGGISVIVAIIVAKLKG